MESLKFLRYCLLSLLMIACGHSDSSKSLVEESPCLRGQYRLISDSFFGGEAFQISPLPSYEQIGSVCVNATEDEKLKLISACHVAESHNIEGSEVDNPVFDQIWTRETGEALVSKLNCPND